ncbi:hypothetical protein PR048_017981 [Dryococelus australis]|uniref:Uncharacterized protein n=1 Tax=Dryococelus australis TaxID=614101 RepID=A0ABQ9HB69_9NEOP|nr:hypothetical protein PR048_017981 [Dryococelus australis]
MDKPQAIYNIDEKGRRLTVYRQQQVLREKGCHNVHMAAPELAENVPIVARGKAIGQTIPPMALFEGQRLNPDRNSNLPACS